MEHRTQQRTMRHMQLAIDMIKEGLIGDIEKIDSWALGIKSVKSPLCSEEPIPNDFDCDRWTGPATLNPYCSDRVTKEGFFFQWDYSIGWIAGWEAHPLDIMIWALKDKLNGKYTCEGTGKYWKPGGICDNIITWDVKYEYESGINLHFFDTMTAKEKNLLNYRKFKDHNRTTFFGTKGWISLSRFSAESNISKIDRKLNDFSKNNSGEIESEKNTMGKYFVDVVTGKIPELCSLDEAILSDCVSHMGNIAIRVGRKITWDPIEGQIMMMSKRINGLFVQ